MNLSFKELLILLSIFFSLLGCDKKVTPESFAEELITNMLNGKKTTFTDTKVIKNETVGSITYYIVSTSIPNPDSLEEDRRLTTWCLSFREQDENGVKKFTNGALGPQKCNESPIPDEKIKFLLNSSKQ
jgi:hypothetical protein